MQYKAFIFDLNGTMVDDMQYHTDAWFNIFKKLGSGITYDQAKKEMYGRNDEVIERVFGKGHFSPAEIRKLSIDKETKYQQDFRPRLQLIKGLDAFLKTADNEGIKMAIGTAAIMFNVDFVLDGLNIRHYFKALVSADEVRRSKPDPETYLKCAEELGVSPANCVVFEDAPKGAEAAQNAGMDAITILTCHGRKDFSGLKNVKFYINDYLDSRLTELF